jgi:diadenosine tetraphosphatase ApaH/serine/threonine PP2A family protein phosphatase
MDYSYYYEAARSALNIHASMLTEESMEWLKSLDYRARDPENDLQLCHGSPVRLEEFEYIFAPEQARECLPLWDDLPGLTLIGHSHLCKVFELDRLDAVELPAVGFKLREDRKYIISVGSVGQPRDYDNRASYTVYDTETRRFEFHRIEYDVELAAEKVELANLDRNFARRLFIGV